MRAYVQTIHTKPLKVQKRFAFLVSAGCTLAIFSIWSLVRFSVATSSAGTTPQQAALVVATDNIGNNPDAAPANTKMITPFENLVSGIKESFSALKTSLSGAKDSVHELQNSVQNEYTDVRNDTVNGN